MSSIGSTAPRSRATSSAPAAAKRSCVDVLLGHGGLCYRRAMGVPGNAGLIAVVAISLAARIAAAQAPPPMPSHGGYGPGQPLPPGAEPTIDKFFRLEGTGFLGLTGADVGGRGTLGYAFGPVFSMHAGGRVYSGAEDISYDLHLGIGWRVKTSGPLAFSFNPEFVLGDGDSPGGGFRIGALYGMRPGSLDLVAAGQIVAGGFGFIALGELGFVAYF
jgi:hypothetical protein